MKDKTTAALLALFLGTFGVHRFYLRQPGLGILYVFLTFTMLSFFLGVIDAIVLFSMDQAEFDRRYNEGEAPGEYDRYRRRPTGNRSRREQQRLPRQQRRAPEYHPRTRRPGSHVPERSRPNPFIQSGIKKYKDFELEEAIADFNKGLEISPRDIALHFNIACAYSLTEKPEKAFFHIDKAVEYGFSDFDRIRNHDDLAYVRIQPEFDAFAEAGFRLVEQKAESKDPIQEQQPSEPEDDKLLSQLKRLAELRDKGLITETEFTAEKEKLMR